MDRIAKLREEHKRQAPVDPRLACPATDTLAGTKAPQIALHLVESEKEKR